MHRLLLFLFASAFAFFFKVGHFPRHTNTNTTDAQRHQYPTFIAPPGFCSPTNCVWIVVTWYL
jgi:hypothetical protein